MNLNPSYDLNLSGATPINTITAALAVFCKTHQDSRESHAIFVKRKVKPPTGSKTQQTFWRLNEQNEKIKMVLDELRAHSMQRFLAAIGMSNASTSNLALSPPLSSSSKETSSISESSMDNGASSTSDAPGISDNVLQDSVLRRKVSNTTTNTTKRRKVQEQSNNKMREIIVTKDNNVGDITGYFSLSLLKLVNLP